MASSLSSIRSALFKTKSLNPGLFFNVFRRTPFDSYKQQHPSIVRCYSEISSSPSYPSLKENQHDYGSLGSQGNFREVSYSLGNAARSDMGSHFGSVNTNKNISPSNLNNFTQSSYQKDAQTGRNLNSMNFVKGILEEPGHGIFGRFQPPQPHVEQNADVVHIKLLRNNTFVTVTDAKGNKKIGASAGSLPGGGKVSRYASEATAEHVGRLARSMGLKAVVTRVKGFTYFKKKRQAILSFREGFTNSRGDKNPIVYIEDATRKPHNGCRLPKQRRV